MVENRCTNSSSRSTVVLDYGPRGEAIRRIRRAIAMLAIVTVIGTLGYMLFDG